VNKKEELKSCCSVFPTQQENNENDIVIDPKPINYGVNKKEELKSCCSVFPTQPQEKLSWTWTINGVIIPLSTTDNMPFAYR
jgi:hypothetical protein